MKPGSPGPAVGGVLEAAPDALCRLVLSDALDGIYRTALTALASGAFMAPDRAADSETLERIVVVHYLRTALGPLAPAGALASLDDVILAFLRTLPGQMIFVYSMSNTGSDQLYGSLCDCNSDNENHVLAFHQYYNSKIRLVESKIRKGCVVKHVLRLGRDVERKVGMVSTVRDPLARLFSSYMYNEIKAGRVDAIARCLGQGEAVDGDLWAAMNRQFEATVTKATREDFFASQIAAASGISIYDAPVDLSDGFAILRKQGLALLILRTEMMERCAPRAFRALIGREVALVPLTDDRVKRTRMRDHVVYREFLSRMRLAGPVFEELYRSAWVRHLFGAAEIADARARWAGNLV